ncbi:MAG: thioredoxin 1 [Saprospiraceae bacterium]|jgi:thioredoxin 1
MNKNISFKELINSNTPVLVDFFAEWCGPCKVMTPVLSEVVSALGNKVKVVKIDVDKNRKLAQELQVRGVPTLMIYKNGKVQWRESGLKSSAYLTQLLEKHIEAA